MTDDFAKGWLQGAFDADGSVILYHNKKTDWHRGYIQLANTDKDIINRAEKCLNQLNIHHQKPRWYDRTKHTNSKSYWKDVCHINIESTQGVNDFLNKIGFSCIYKQKKLKEIVTYKNRPNAPKRIKPPNRKILKNLYWKRKLDMTEIAEKFGYASNVSILRLMRKYVIPTRSRSDVLKLVWQTKRNHNN